MPAQGSKQGLQKVQEGSKGLQEGQGPACTHMVDALALSWSRTLLAGTHEPPLLLLPLPMCQ